MWVQGEPNRLDALTRQIVGGYLRSHFNLSTRHGWAWEGLGMYLTHLAVGTHLTFFVPTSSGGGVEAKLDTSLMEPEADWLVALVEVMSGDDPPELAPTLEADVSGMDIRQLVLAHGLAAYLIEVQSDKLPMILARTGGGHDAAVVLKEELERSTTTLLADMLRWAESMLPDEE